MDKKRGTLPKYHEPQLKRNGHSEKRELLDTSVRYQEIIQVQNMNNFKNIDNEKISRIHEYCVNLLYVKP